MIIHEPHPKQDRIENIVAARHVFRWVAKACWRQQDWIDDYSRHNPAYRSAYDTHPKQDRIENIVAARHVFRWVAKACWRQQDWIDDYSRHNPAYRSAYDRKRGIHGTFTVRQIPLFVFG